MTENASKFTQLSKYALHVVAGEQMQAKQFQEGLRLNIRAHVTSFMLYTYSEVMVRALIIARDMEETQRLGSRNSKFDSSGK